MEITWLPVFPSTVNQVNHTLPGVDLQRWGDSPWLISVEMFEEFPPSLPGSTRFLYPMVGQVSVDQNRVQLRTLKRKMLILVNTCEYWDTKKVFLCMSPLCILFTWVANLHKEFIKSTQSYFTNQADVTWLHYDSPIIWSPWLSICVRCKNVFGMSMFTQPFSTILHSL